MPREFYALSPEELKARLDSDIARQGKRYKGVFEPILRVAQRVMAKRPRAKEADNIDPSLVKEVACVLEAALVMAEDAPPNAELNIIVRNLDLSHFVSYMRGLDAMARELAVRNGQLVERLESLNGRNHEQTKDREEAAKDRPPDDHCFSGEAIAREARLLGQLGHRDQRSEDDKRDLSLAESPSEARPYRLPRQKFHEKL